VEKCGRTRQAIDKKIIWRMRFACCVTKATDTHLECVILIAFPRQQRLRERASVLRLHVHCLSCIRVLITLRPESNILHIGPQICCKICKEHIRYCLEYQQVAWCFVRHALPLEGKIFHIKPVICTRPVYQTHVFRL
jgi:hypothetical protein